MSKSKLMGIAILSLAATTAAYAKKDKWDYVGPSTVVAAPEIDPAGLFSGLTLLAGGLAVIRGRRSK